MPRKRQTIKSVLSSLKYSLEQKRVPSPRVFDLVNDAMDWIKEIEPLKQQITELKANGKLTDAIEYAAKTLQDEHVITMEIQHGSVSMYLSQPWGITIIEPNDQDLADQIIRAVELAGQ